MEAYQQRVVEEKIDLDKRRDSLELFIGSGVFNALPKEERDLLMEQRSVMSLYSQVMWARIRRWREDLPEGVAEA